MTMRDRSVAVALMALCVGSLVLAGNVTPIPTPPYLPTDAIGEYRWRGVSSQPGLGSVLGTSRHREGASDLYHHMRYTTDSRARYAEIEVEEIEDGTWAQQEIECYARGRAAQVSLCRPEVRQIAGQNIIYVGCLNVAEYLWVSGGNRAIHIQAPRDKANPEGAVFVDQLPESFLAAYLAALPSDLPPFEFDEAHFQQWVRNEFDRHFFYVANLLLELTTASDLKRRVPLVGAVDQRLNGIVELRAKYFGGPSLATWQADIPRRLQLQFPGADPWEMLNAQPQVEARVNELKQWWAQHRDDPILLPTPTAMPTPANTPTP
jgi:hypothetical protein